VDPATKENPIDETLGDENKPRNAIFFKSPNNEAYPEENPDNDNCFEDTILLGSLERKIHDKQEPKGEAPLGDTVQLKHSLMLTQYHLSMTFRKMQLNHRELEVP